MKTSWIYAVSIFALFFIFLVVYAIIKATAPEVNPFCSLDNPNGVNRVIDGDTFELCSGEIVRLLCIDTPEEGEDGYEDAKYFLEDLILNKEVILAPSDEGANDRDRYDRLLRFVYLNNSEFAYDPAYDEFYVNYSEGKMLLVNKLLLEEGYGDLMTIVPETCGEVAD